MERIWKSVKVEALPLSSLRLPTKWRNGIPLFNAKDALLLVNYCSQNGIFVLGADGFRLEGKFIIPDLSCTTDFSELLRISGASFPERSIAAMKIFLTLVPNDVFLEFVLTELTSKDSHQYKSTN